MADEKETKVSDIIAGAWTAAEGSGLSDGIDASNRMIRAMTDAVAKGVVSALPDTVSVRGFFWSSISGLRPVMSDRIMWRQGSGARLSLIATDEAATLMVVVSMDTGGAVSLHGATGTPLKYDMAPETVRATSAVFAIAF